MLKEPAELATTPPQASGSPDDGAGAAEHFQNAVRAAPIGIICISGAKGQYVFANEAYAKMIGRSLEEVLNTDPYQIATDATHPEDRSLGRDGMASIAKGEVDRYTYEKRLLLKSGEVRWASVDMVATRNAEGRLSFLTLYFTDIQDRRAADQTQERLAAELREAQKLEALGRLAGGVAHDFNNRLVIIMGYTELLMRGLPAKSPLAAHADLVLESAHRATDLTRQLLAYSRRQAFKPRVMDLNSTVANMRRLLERLIGDNVELATRLSATHPIFADPGHLEQVIMNLAVNARDAMSNGGTLLLETRDATLTANDRTQLAPGDYVALVASDTGEGIPEDVLPSIFEPFFTTKEVGRGTGLGLSTAQGIVEQVGGAIHVKSSVGRGTTFVVYLPRATEAPTEASAPIGASPARGLRFETVLLCEDDEGVRRLMASVLALRGYTVLEARNGEHALEVAAAHPQPIHLLITDLVMPKLGGVELAARIRTQNERLRVLYVSGHTDNRAVLSGSLESGALFLPKPFLPGDLTAAVCSLLEGHEPGRAAHAARPEI